MEKATPLWVWHAGGCTACFCIGQPGFGYRAESSTCLGMRLIWPVMGHPPLDLGGRYTCASGVKQWAGSIVLWEIYVYPILTHLAPNNMQLNTVLHIQPLLLQLTSSKSLHNSTVQLLQNYYRAAIRLTHETKRFADIRWVTQDTKRKHGTRPHIKLQSWKKITQLIVAWSSLSAPIAWAHHLSWLLCKFRVV